MSHILEYVEQVQGLAPRFTKCPEHQRLAYAIETVVEGALPPSTVSLEEARAFIERVCLDEGHDVPEIVHHAMRAFTACAKHDAYTIVLGERSTNVLTLCHELAHLIEGKGVGHDGPWRDQFVHLARRHVSLEHGALLHNLYQRCGLRTAW